MTRITLLLTVLTTGCSLLPTRYGTTPGESAAIQLYPHEADYELLSYVAGEACMGQDALKEYRNYKSQDPRAIGHGVLFEWAKYNALESVKTADGVIGLRSKVELKNGHECVSVTGRAYRIRSLRAVAPGEEHAKKGLPAGTMVPEGL